MDKVSGDKDEPLNVNQVAYILAHTFKATLRNTDGNRSAGRLPMCSCADCNRRREIQSAMYRQMNDREQIEAQRRISEMERRREQDMRDAMRIQIREFTLNSNLYSDFV